MIWAMTTRQYRMRKRRDDIENTRRRIVEAAVDLHGSVGPVNTTFSAVAERAGVQRSTVYRHFPDEEALFGACTSHYLARNPWPDPAMWRNEDDPLRRLRQGLGDVYAYFDGNRSMLGNSFRDIEVMPPFVGELMAAQMDLITDGLLDAWGEEASDEIRSAVGFALDFRTWQALDDQGLAPGAAADLMTAMASGLVAT